MLARLASRLFGPPAVLEITLTKYEDGELGFQFQSFQGVPVNLYEVANVFTAMAQAAVRQADRESNGTPARSRPTPLFPIGGSDGPRIHRSSRA